MSPVVDRLLAGELLAWLELEAQLLLWGERPAWADEAGVATVLTLAPRLDWPRPRPDWREVDWPRDLPRGLGRMARGRWRAEVALARPRPLPRWDAHGIVDPGERLWVDVLSRVVGRARVDRGNWSYPVVLWPDMLADVWRVPVRPCLEPDERQALDLVAAVLGAPA